MKKILDHDPLTGITRVFHYDESVDDMNFIIETSQNVDALVEQNRREYNEGVKRADDMRKVASIPLNVFMELQKKGITRDPVAMKRWLNDPDNRFFRTSPEYV